MGDNNDQRDDDLSAIVISMQLSAFLMDEPAVELRQVSIVATDWGEKWMAVV